MKTLIIGTIHPDAKKLLENPEQQEEITRSDAEVLIIRTYTTLGKEELNLLPNLKYVISCSVGINNIDLDELKLRNIELIHTPGTNANSVAEHTMYLILSLLREDAQPYSELKGKTVGIIGLGYIGKVVAKKLIGFECNVIAFDVIEQDEELLKELHVAMKSFDEVIKQADVLSIHVPLNKHTKHLINEDTFTKMKQGVFFVNASRAEVVDEEALVRFSNQGKFRGVGLDVCSKTANFDGKHVIITDHCGAQGEDSYKNQCVAPIELFLKVSVR